MKIVWEERIEKKWAKNINFDNWLKKVLNELGKMKLVEKTQGGEIELKFIGLKEIKSLNNEYRGINIETDVLSFSFLGEKSFPDDSLVGQIFICPEIAQKQAIDHQVSYKDEVEFLFVHALLHVFGLDHEKKADFKIMFDIQLKLFPEIKWRDYVEQIFQEYFG